MENNYVCRIGNHDYTPRLENRVMENSAWAENPIHGEKYSINLSREFSVLIQQAARWCEYYTSDILYDIDAIKKGIQSEPAGKVVIGFRRSGTDNILAIESNLGDRPLYEGNYSAVWAFQWNSGTNQWGESLATALYRIY